MNTYTAEITIMGETKIDNETIRKNVTFFVVVQADNEAEAKEAAEKQLYTKYYDAFQRECGFYWDCDDVDIDIYRS